MSQGGEEEVVFFSPSRFPCRAAQGKGEAEHLSGTEHRCTSSSRQFEVGMGPDKLLLTGMEGQMLGFVQVSNSPLCIILKLNEK